MSFGTARRKIVQQHAQTQARPPTDAGAEAALAKDDLNERLRRLKGRRASRLTTPGLLAISDVNILRPDLKDKLA